MKIEGVSIQSLDTDSYKLKNNTDDTDKFKLQLEKAFDKQDEEKLREVCSDFEAMFMQMVYKQMKATIPKAELMPKTFARETFEEMLEEEVISKAAKGRGMGLGDMLFKQLSARMHNTYKPLDSSKDINNT